MWTKLYSLDQCHSPSLASSVALEITLKSLELDVVAAQDLGRDRPHGKTNPYEIRYLPVLNYSEQTFMTQTPALIVGIAKWSH